MASNLKLDPEPRTRFRESDVEATAVRTKEYGDGRPDVIDSNPFFSSESSEVMEDWVVPHFKARQARGEIFNNPMSRTIEGWTRVPGDYELSYSGEYVDPDDHSLGTISDSSYAYTGKYQMSTGVEDNAVWPALPSGFVSQLRDIAITEAHARANVRESELLVTLAEANKTANSLLDLIRKAWRILLAVRKLRLKEIARELSPQELANEYLRARYALRPLAFEVEGIVEAWNKTLEESRETSRGWGSGTFNDSTEVDSVDYTEERWHTKVTRTTTVDIRAGVLSEIDTDKLPSFLAVWGVDAVLESAWELVPFSFIIDWFFNIGTTIAAWTPSVAVTPLISWVKTTQTDIVQIERWGTRALEEGSKIGGYWPDELYTGYVFDAGVCRSTFVRTTIDREPEPDLPILPKLHVNLDALNITDITEIYRKRLTRVR